MSLGNHSSAHLCYRVLLSWEMDGRLHPLHLHDIEAYQSFILFCALHFGCVEIFVQRDYSLSAFSSWEIARQPIIWNPRILDSEGRQLLGERTHIDWAAWDLADALMRRLWQALLVLAEAPLLV